jgi:hypothetical protein
MRYLQVLKSGSTEERSSALVSEGARLGELVAHLVRDLNLAESTVSIAGWDMGCVYSLALMRALNERILETDVREVLRRHVRSFLLLGTT